MVIYIHWRYTTINGNTVTIHPYRPYLEPTLVQHNMQVNEQYIQTHRMSLSQTNKEGGPAHSSDIASQYSCSCVSRPFSRSQPLSLSEVPGLLCMSSSACSPCNGGSVTWSVGVAAGRIYVNEGGIDVIRAWQGAMMQPHTTGFIWKQSVEFGNCLCVLW